MKYKIFLTVLVMFVACNVNAQEKPEPAVKVLDDACKLASKENKNVMIVFHASWCGWCRKFEASVIDPSCKDFFDKHFVIRYLDILESPEKQNLENPGAIDIYKKNGGDGSGVPYFLIYDNNKVLLTDSKIKAAGDGPEKPQQNMGCPASDDEVVAFVNILEKTTKITEAEKTAIKTRFRKNGK
jgi:thiol-disulfide isomerase/thioredoxin